jgi:hypothetical protein
MVDRHLHFFSLLTEVLVQHIEEAVGEAPQEEQRRDEDEGPN